MNLKIVKSIKTKDNISIDEEHCSRVAQYAYFTAVSLGLDKNVCSDILLAAQYHDVGKAFLDKTILNKPGKLTDEEMEYVKYHVLYSAAIAIEMKFNINVVRNIYYHHENFNGIGGYPAGLKDRDIPVGARVIRIADFYDALTNDRVYRPKYKKDEAIKIILNNKNLLDPDILNVFISNLDKRVFKTYSDKFGARI